MKNKKSGFTMIELLVVVAIVGVLSMAAQVRFNKSYNRNLVARASYVAFTLMKLCKHLTILENRDYIYCAYSVGGNPGSAAWQRSFVTGYKSISPFYPDAAVDPLVTFSSSVYEECKKPSLRMPLPDGAAVVVTGSDPNIPEGSGTINDPYRTIFKFYGTCPANNGRYYICPVGVFAQSGFASANKEIFHTVLPAGGNFSGAPVLLEYGYW